MAQETERYSFKAVFVAVVLGLAIVLAAFLVNRARPAVEITQPTAQLVKATGKCAACHRQETSAIVHQFERSNHASHGVTCLDCHRPAEGQQAIDHKGFQLSARLTSKNCATCHVTQYDQFVRSRHAGAAWGAVVGAEGFSPAQVALTEKYHPHTVNRPANPLLTLEGPGAVEKGCGGCHNIGMPNADGSFGSCTHCHARHSASVALARAPSTCGQCHMGPDHAQIEIYTESKHGALFAAQQNSMNLSADPKHLTTADMPVPTCATCHMSGLEGLKVTHDVTERLSWYLFADISTKRPGYERAQNEMREVCKTCHASSQVKWFFEQAEVVVAATNEKLERSLRLVAELRQEGLLTPEPFDEPLEFLAFDLWHYYGRTAKHGAFMGGADFVQWHGNYELLHLDVELRAMARELRAHRGEPAAPRSATP